MTSFRILHVDDDAFMRDIVDLSLSSDPQFVVMSCAGGEEALAAVPGWQPDLIILDVMMPGMDGPTVLARLKEDADTAKTPVIFMTSHASPPERDRYIAMGAIAVITKPFYPIKLAETVRRHLQSIRLASAGYNFAKRLHADAVTLADFRDRLRDGADDAALLEDLQTFAHKLAGAAGIFDFQAVSAQAALLEDAIIERRAGRGDAGAVGANLDVLLACIEERLIEPART